MEHLENEQDYLDNRGRMNGHEYNHDYLIIGNKYVFDYELYDLYIIRGTKYAFLVEDSVRVQH